MTKLSSCFACDIKAFLEFRLGLGYSNYSFEFYLNKFDEYCCSVNHETRELPQDLVMGWLNKAMENGEKGLPCRGRAIRTFAKYLNSEGVSVYVAPVKYFETKSSFVPYILSTIELTAFFEATDTLPKRNIVDAFGTTVAPVIFRMMYTCGLRPSEVRKLTCKDVNSDTGEILVSNNKTRKERVVVMSDDMIRLCKEYEQKREDFFVRSIFYFPCIDGTAYENQQLNGLFKNCWKHANPNVPKAKLPIVRPYDLRHCFASAVLQKWLDEGRDLLAMIPYLRTYMGHEHIEDTVYYIHILPERLVNSPGVNWELMDSIMPEVSVWED